MPIKNLKTQNSNLTNLEQEKVKLSQTFFLLGIPNGEECGAYFGAKKSESDPDVHLTDLDLK